MQTIREIIKLVEAGIFGGGTAEEMAAARAAGQDLPGHRLSQQWQKLGATQGPKQISQWSLQKDGNKYIIVGMHNGNSWQTTPLKSIDFEKKIAITRNSTYQLT